MLPLEAAAKWDNSGDSMYFGKYPYFKKWPMPGSLPIVYELKRYSNNGAHFYIDTHHPLLLEPVYFNKFDNYQKNSCPACKKRSLGCIRPILLGRKTPEGPVRFLAEALKLKNIEVLDPFLC